jgi:Asp-tRNA(Asn)/Glu-tRNA(Gln) amidotransferase A subunit family amidase
MSRLIFLSAVSMAEQIRKKKISPVELVEAHLAQIEKLNPRLNAFVQVDAERVRRAAHDAENSVREKTRQEALGPLHGVPISIKSSISVAGLLRSWESVARRVHRTARCAAGGTTEERWRDHPGNNQHARTSHGMGNR